MIEPGRLGFQGKFGKSMQLLFVVFYSFHPSIPVQVVLKVAGGHPVEFIHLFSKCLSCLVDMLHMVYLILDILPFPGIDSLVPDPG